MIIKLIAAAALIALGSAAAAETRSATVSYGDLNVSTTAGQKVLSARIAAAARSVCSHDTFDLASMVAAKRCLLAAITGATDTLQSRNAIQVAAR